MTNKIEFEQGRTYIVKWNPGYGVPNKIKVLRLTDTHIEIEWTGGFASTYDLQKFKYEYSIVEEVG